MPCRAAGAQRRTPSHSRWRARIHVGRVARIVLMPSLLEVPGEVGDPESVPAGLDGDTLQQDVLRGQFDVATVGRRTDLQVGVNNGNTLKDSRGRNTYSFINHRAGVVPGSK